MKVSECTLEELQSIIKIGNEAVLIYQSTINFKESLDKKINGLLRSNLWDTTKTYNPAEIGVGNTYASGYIKGLEYLYSYVNEKVNDKVEAEKELVRRSTKLDRSSPMSWLNRMRAVTGK